MMKKLEEIGKDNIFKVPEKYFDELPMRIQSRIKTRNEPALMPSFNWNLAVKLAVPAIMLIVAILLAVFVNKNETYKDADTILAEVSTEDMIAYLQASDISLDEILDEIQYTDIDDEFSDQTLLFDENELTDELFDEIILDYGINEI